MHSNYVAANGLELKQPRLPRERHKFAFLTTKTTVLHALHVCFYFCTLGSRSQPFNEVCVHDVSTS